jgi:hypothetical protein
VSSDGVRAKLNVSDIFTKPLAVHTFAKHRSGLGVMPLTTREYEETCMSF